MANYEYSPELLKELLSAISVSRLDAYLISANGELRKALELHAWNNALATASLGPILNIELLLRNKCSDELATLYQRNDWYNAFPATPNYAYLRNRIEYVQRKLKKYGKNSNHPPQIIANVSFGFWLALFEKHLHRDLWVPALYKVFKYPPPDFSRHEAWVALTEIRDMRNRSAHHGSLFNQDLLSFEERMLALARYMSPEFAAWMKHHSQLKRVWHDSNTH